VEFSLYKISLMIVLMTVADKVIETRVIPLKNLQISGYLEGLKKDMIEQNEDIIDLTKEKPEFRLEDTMDQEVIN
jgi:hypothetical protein